MKFDSRNRIDIAGDDREMYGEGARKVLRQYTKFSGKYSHFCEHVSTTRKIGKSAF